MASKRLCSAHAIAAAVAAAAAPLALEYPAAPAAAAAVKLDKVSDPKLLLTAAPTLPLLLLLSLLMPSPPFLSGTSLLQLPLLLGEVDALVFEAGDRLEAAVVAVVFGTNSAATRSEALRSSRLRTTHRSHHFPG